ncbi:unnamed protein product [Ilex paraguariensis]|uniref:Uncharacterized protein n=1 Tax=Ilex paraguariensis TaxID=185542 RepID=A0ABC8UB72_9AQUA
MAEDHIVPQLGSGLVIEEVLRGRFVTQELVRKTIVDHRHAKDAITSSSEKRAKTTPTTLELPHAPTTHQGGVLRSLSHRKN